MIRVVRQLQIVASLVIAIGALASQARADPADAWRDAWPRTNFSTHIVDLGEIRAGGPSKDGIPSIDRPEFRPVAEITDLAPTEPVIELAIGSEARAYPLRILTWHEIVNDEIGGVPVAVTYCPLYNAAVVFDRRLDGRVLDFGIDPHR